MTEGGVGMGFLARIDRYLVRHQKLLASIGFIWLMVVSAHYARFITLPDVIEIPVVASGLLIGLRYALWDGMIKPRLEKQVELETRD